MSVSKIREARGFVNVEFLEPLGKVKKGTKQQMHRSTAMSLETTKTVKIVSDVKDYKPKKIKE